MFKNYLKLTIRNLWKHKIISFVNIFGLSIGIAASLILFLYTKSELSYDKFHKDYDRIYRVRCDNLTAGQYAERMARTNGPVAQAIKNTFPEVENVVQLESDNLDGLLSTDIFKFRIQNSFFASEDFFKIFSYKLIKGDPNTALKESKSIVLTESLAKKFFGNRDPMGKILKCNGDGGLKVTGVCQDAPVNTHLKFEALISYCTLTKYFAPYMAADWDAGESVYTYIKLKPGTDAWKLEKKFPAMVKQNIGPYLAGKNHDKQYFLQPLADIHLNSNYDGEIEANGDSKSIKFLLIIAFLILIIAWINYVNLSTTRSMERFKEIGVRMVSGASKNQLKRQFILEAILLNVIAVVIALVIAKLIYPYFSNYTGMKIRPEVWGDKTVWFIFSIAILVGSILSSVYPAFILTSVNPVMVLKSKNYKTNEKFPFKKLLLVFQFSISISLIIATIVVHEQVTFIKNQDLGVNINQTLILHKPSITDSTWFKKLDGFKNSLKQYPSITNVCLSRYVPGEPINYSQGYVRQGNITDKSAHLLYSNFSDADFTDLYALQFLAGRNFTRSKRDFEIIINRKALETLGFKKPEDAINQEVYNEGWKRNHTIVGVVENFHQRAAKEDYVPMSYMHCDFPFIANKFSIKVNTKNMKETISQIEVTWNNFFPGNAFEYFFLNEQYNNQYKADIQFGRAFLLFSVLAVMIACIGLFALTLYVILQRSKEVAIRKVIGASAVDIFSILTKDYFILIGISSVIALPIMYWIMEKWLQNYACRIHFNWLFFILPVLILLTVVLLSVFFQIVKAVKTDPVKSLRTE